MIWILVSVAGPCQLTRPADEYAIPVRAFTVAMANCMPAVTGCGAANIARFRLREQLTHQVDHPCGWSVTPVGVKTVRMTAPGFYPLSDLPDRQSGHPFRRFSGVVRRGLTGRVS